MKKLVLTLAIHDKNVTMAKPTQVSFIIRTGLTPPPEDCRATKTHRNNELGITTFSKQRFVIAVPTHARSPSPIKVQVHRVRHFPLSTPRPHYLIRGAIALDTPASSGQHRCPVHGPLAGPCPYAYEQVHEEPQGTDHAVWYDPFLTQSPAATRAEKKLSPWRAPRNNHTPDLTVFCICDQPSVFLIVLPGPGGSGE